MFARMSLIIVVFLASSIVGCSPSISPTLPPNAILLFYGPVGNMSVSGPNNATAGTLYVVDASNGKVVFAAYGEGGEKEGDKTRTHASTSGLKKGHTYTVYFVPSNN